MSLGPRRRGALSASCGKRLKARQGNRRRRKQIQSLDTVGTVAVSEQPCCRRVGFPLGVKCALNEGHQALLRLVRTLKSLTEMTEFRIADTGQVEDLKAAAKALRERGWDPDGRPFEIPNGPCYVLDDPRGKRFGFFENVRPKAFERNHNGSSLRCFRKTSISFMVWT